jgi:hypothetical protein
MNEWVYVGIDNEGDLVFATHGCTLHVSRVALANALSTPAVLQGVLKANFDLKQEIKNTVPPVVELVL